MNKFFLLIIISVFFSCNNKQQNQTIQEGDLLFQNLDCGDLCNAIEAVTEGVNGKDFSHCSLVIKDNDTLKVVEAIGGNVQINTLHNFFKRSNDTNAVKNITVARLKNSYKNLIPTATTFAKKQIGTAYDDEFVLNNNKLYCSELLYEAFKTANNNKDFFSLHPMTYKEPMSNNFFPAWIEYYKNLNKEIPEGKLGLNPGSISRDEKLEIIPFDTFKD